MQFLQLVTLDPMGHVNLIASLTPHLSLRGQVWFSGIMFVADMGLV